MCNQLGVSGTGVGDSAISDGNQEPAAKAERLTPEGLMPRWLVPDTRKFVKLDAAMS
jgi:hypothetical protein